MSARLWGSPLQDVVRDAAGADLTEGGGGGGNSGGATWAEAEAQSERGEAGAGGRVEDGSRERRRVAGGDGRRHGCRGGNERAIDPLSPTPPWGRRTKWRAAWPRARHQHRVPRVARLAHSPRRAAPRARSSRRRPAPFHRLLGLSEGCREKVWGIEGGRTGEHR